MHRPEGSASVETDVDRGILDSVQIREEIQTEAWKQNGRFAGNNHYDTTTPVVRSVTDDNILCGEVSDSNQEQFDDFEEPTQESFLSNSETNGLELSRLPHRRGETGAGPPPQGEVSGTFLQP
ncbi:hypothetical protein F2P81_024728 [Scophthalmus maximus]|uniref:Uncharacterized protein n=1 Tax=Scophthalmus maximus TaxID=52904 RepID=A0A6A4RR14_SCOMX|nr:hypothetical protein F2P81_024728 [Scophthalmus maximus]